MAQRTRERILDAAWELFQRQGFTGTTVTQIEAAATPSRERGFRSRQDVFRAVIDREVERAAADSDVETEIVDQGGDVRVALDANPPRQKVARRTRSEGFRRPRGESVQRRAR